MREPVQNVKPGARSRAVYGCPVTIGLAAGDRSAWSDQNSEEQQRGGYENEDLSAHEASLSAWRKRAP